MSYTTAEGAIRDGWMVIYGKAPWWNDALRYSVTAKRGEFHVELGGNSLTELRREVRRLDSLPIALRFTRGWWALASRETNASKET